MAGRHNLSGIWHSTYWYPSNVRPGKEDTSEYTMEAYQRGGKLVLESLPNNIKAHMTVNLSVDGNVVTGTWYENTSPHGEFEGMVYSGALQLVVGGDGDTLEGKWVGIGREKLEDGSYEPRIYSGKWLLKRAGEQEVAAAEKARAYEAA